MLLQQVHELLNLLAGPLKCRPSDAWRISELTVVIERYILHLCYTISLTGSVPIG